MFGLEEELQDRVARLKKEKKLAYERGRADGEALNKRKTRFGQELVAAANEVLAYERGRADAFREALNMVRKIIRAKSRSRRPRP